MLQKLSISKNYLWDIGYTYRIIILESVFKNDSKKYLKINEFLRENEYMYMYG